MLALSQVSSLAQSEGFLNSLESIYGDEGKRDRPMRAKSDYRDHNCKDWEQRAPEQERGEAISSCFQAPHSYLPHLLIHDTYIDYMLWVKLSWVIGIQWEAET